MAKHLHAVTDDGASSDAVRSMLERLGDTIERVKAGEICTVVIFRDFTGDKYDIVRSDTENKLELLGKLEMAQHAIMNGKL